MPIIIKFTHFSGVDTPICPECQALDMTFFNPECFGCQSELRKMADHGIGIASIMAVLRQWIPQGQITQVGADLQLQGKSHEYFMIC